MTVKLSLLDTRHFGINIARVRADMHMNAAEIDRQCINNDIDMVIVRCGNDEWEEAVVENLIYHDFIQVDTLVWYRKKLADVYPEVSPHIRLATEKDLHKIETIARRAFTNYNGHYHEDKRLDPNKSTEAYVNWALSHQEAVKKFVFDDGEVKGFVLVDTESSQVPLYAVDTSAQGKGIGKALINAALDVCKRSGRETFSISTQENNKKSIGVWKSLGFEFSHAFFTFHKWYK